MGESAPPGAPRIPGAEKACEAWVEYPRERAEREGAQMAPKLITAFARSAGAAPEPTPDATNSGGGVRRERWYPGTAAAADPTPPTPAPFPPKPPTPPPDTGD